MKVTTQSELDVELAKPGYAEITIDSPRGVWLTIRSNDGKYVEAYGSATVRAYGSATVRAYGSATVRAYGSATVEAYGSATVRAYGSATVRATPYVAIHLFSTRVTINGGVVIDITKIDRTKWDGWQSYHGVEYLSAKSSGDGELIVYKAVDANLKSGRGFTYPIGETVTCPDYEEGDFCGNGLHLSPHPHQARQYFPAATRFLRCAVRASDACIIDGNSAAAPKLKARVVRVLSEVTIDGEEVAS